MKHIIETERLILRPWKESDADVIVLGFSDFETAKMLTVPFPYTKEDAISFILKSKSEDDNNFHFAITLKETGTVIGGTSLCVDRKNNTNSGGIWLDKNYQGFDSFLYYQKLLIHSNYFLLLFLFRYTFAPRN